MQQQHLLAADYQKTDFSPRLPCVRFQHLPPAKERFIQRDFEILPVLLLPPCVPSWINSLSEWWVPDWSLISLFPRALGISSSVDICIMHTGLISYQSASYFNYLNSTVNESGAIALKKQNRIIPTTTPVQRRLFPWCRLLLTRWPSWVEWQNFLEQRCPAVELQTSKNCGGIVLLSTN